MLLKTHYFSLSFTLLTTTVFLGIPLFAQSPDVVYITSRPQPTGTGANPDGTYTEVGISMSDTSAKGTATGHPATSGSRAYLGSAVITDTGAGVDLTPTLHVPGAVYQIDYNYDSQTGGNGSTDVVMTASSTVGGLSFSSTDKFQRQYGTPRTQWQTLGFFTNVTDNSAVTISFRYESGRVSAAGSGAAANRLYLDTWRFTQVIPCLAVPVVSVTGPLSTNLPNVTVTGVSNTATAITIYQNGGTGMTNVGTVSVSGPSNTVAVPISGLVAGAQVAATQTIGGQEGCIPTAGTIVGTGPNATFRVALSVRENIDLTGPAGATGPGTNVNIYYIGASSLLPGAAPEQGFVISPSNGWQTITFNRGPDPLNPVDPVVIWNSGAGSDAVLDGNYGVLDGFAIASEGDTGPFDLYIDDMSNGTNGVLQNWESATVGANNYQFSAPITSGTTSGNILPNPNISQVTTAASYSGSKSLLLKFQFSGTESNKWVRIVTAGATGANPQIDLNEPISFRFLLLPVGVAPVSSVPSNISITHSNGNVTLNWTGTYQLQSAPNVIGPYTDVTGVTNAPYTVPANASEAYFRLRNQVN